LRTMTNGAEYPRIHDKWGYRWGYGHSPRTPAI
jgi:hypothetical protein